MTIDLHKLDALSDCDEATAALDNYVGDLVNEFINTAEGKNYLAAYPAMQEFVGSWIYQLLYLGRNYELVTLPQMTKSHIKGIVTKLFPRKIILGDPDEADTAIPELLAFWQFIQRVYKLPQAKQILALLKQLQPEFKEIMNDTSNFGIGKSLMVDGLQAGFDLTQQVDLDAYKSSQNQVNRSINPLNLNTLLENLGIGKVEGGADFISILRGSISSASGVEAPSGISVLELLRQGIQASQWQSGEDTSVQLSVAATALLENQIITTTAPGTILQDFQTLLDFIGTGIAVSNNNKLLPIKSLAEVNQRLCNPIDIDLKRPVQKSYPPIDGLYLLLRASGIGQVHAQGKKYLLTLNPKLLATWQSFNPTERYFLLLETWIIRAHVEILGEWSVFNLGSRCFEFWPMIPAQGRKFANYDEQRTLSYCPELRNIALLNMFGFICLKTVKPTPGKGWRIKQITRLPFGNAMMTLLRESLMSVGLCWPSETDPSLPFAELQPFLQPYFLEWQNVLKPLTDKY
jgi:hypothetical protein